MCLWFGFTLECRAEEPIYYVHKRSQIWSMRHRYRAPSQAARVMVPRRGSGNGGAWTVLRISGWRIQTIIWSAWSTAFAAVRGKSIPSFSSQVDLQGFWWVSRRSLAPVCCETITLPSQQTKMFPNSTLLSTLSCTWNSFKAGICVVVLRPPANLEVRFFKSWERAAA